MSHLKASLFPLFHSNNYFSAFLFSNIEMSIELQSIFTNSTVLAHPGGNFKLSLFI